MKKYSYLPIILILILPTIIGFLSSNDKVFSGLTSPTDGNTYLSFMNQAREGNFLFTNMYTSEDVPYILFRPTYLIAGLLAQITNLPNILIYHLFRIIGIIIFIYFLNKLISLYFKNKRDKKLTLFICIFASGFGFLFKLFTLLFSLKEFGSIDFWVTDANNFLILLSHPHTIFSVALMTASVYYFLEWYKKAKVRFILISSFFSLILGFEHLFDVITIYSAIGFLLIDKIIKDKKIEFNKLAHLILFGLITSVPFIYNYVVYTSVPSYALWNAQNLLESPRIISVIFGYGFMFISFVIFLFYQIKNKNYFKLNPAIKFLVYWIVSALILAYSPFNIQRRFFEGLHTPFGIITGIFILSIVPTYIKYINRKKLTNLTFFILLLMTPTNIYVFLNEIVNLDNGRGSFPYSVNRYLYKDEHDAMLWLAKNTEKDSVIISSYNIGNYVPAYVNRRVYLAHWAQTLEFDKKTDDIINFYKNGKELQIINKIKYVWYGIDEKNINDNFLPPPNSEIVFKNNKITIFKVI